MKIAWVLGAITLLLLIVLLTYDAGDGAAVDIRSQVYGNVAPGKIYTTLFNLHLFDPTAPDIQPYTLLMDAAGNVLWSRAEEHGTLDFKKLDEETYVLTYFQNKTGRWDGLYAILNDAFEPTRELTIVENEHTDIHGIIQLRNGNMLVPSYNLHLLDGTMIESFLLQEIDPQGNVVFSWDSIDHVPLSATSPSHRETRPFWLEHEIHDYFHGNSVFELPDGDLLVSGRNVSQVVRVNRANGEIEWRLGGTDSDFTFVNDPLDGFNFQHSVTMLPNGNVLLYDNGNAHTPPQSRIVEYALDMDKMTATLVWSYQIPGKFTYATGSVQRLSNGNTFIGWGVEADYATSTVRISEVDPYGVPVLEIYFPPGAGLYSAYKYE